MFSNGLPISVGQQTAGELVLPDQRIIKAVFRVIHLGGNRAAIWFGTQWVEVEDPALLGAIYGQYVQINI